MSSATDSVNSPAARLRESVAGLLKYTDRLQRPAGHAIAGPNGLLAWGGYHRDLAERRAELASLEAERAQLRHRSALLNPKSLEKFIVEKMQLLGTAACPPYHLVFVIGGIYGGLFTATEAAAAGAWLALAAGTGLLAVGALQLLMSGRMRSRTRAGRTRADSAPKAARAISTGKAGRA